MANWMNLADMVRVYSRNMPHKAAFVDEDGKQTFSALNDRVNRLANGLTDLGLVKGDKVAVLMDNSREIVEVYLACAKAGLIIAPINFRLAPADIQYIVIDSDSRAVIVQEDFLDALDKARTSLPDNLQYFSISDETFHGYKPYEELISSSSSEEPERIAQPSDPWVLLYTSGTTGIPKGVIRSHESYVAFYLINAIDFGFGANDVCLNILPLCHVNSTFFSFTFTYIGASVYLHSARSFNPVNILETIQRQKITFISLIPTHYNLMLNVPEEEWRHYDVSSIRKLLCSSAPARKKIKKGIMSRFNGVELYEAYGSTEAGIVTISKPKDQLTKIGSIGRESLGTDTIKILDENKVETPQGSVGELYSSGPMMFSGYHKQPEVTKQAFVGDWFSAGDMAKQDEDGYYYLVDRKHNMIITGGEHVYPSEVEHVIATHPKVFDVAVIGIPHQKWGEAVTAVIIPRANSEIEETEVIEFCRDKIASFKKPKSVIFISEEEMPRTMTGKILHRVLRERYRENL